VLHSLTINKIDIQLIPIAREHSCNKDSSKILGDGTLRKSIISWESESILHYTGRAQVFSSPPQTEKQHNAMQIRVLYTTKVATK